MFSYPSINACVLGAQKNCLIETVLLRTRNICFECKIKKKSSPIRSCIWSPAIGIGPPLLLFNKVHCGAVSIEKDKYLTPAQSLKTTRSSHSAQFCRYQTDSDALKNSFFPELFSGGIAFLLQWSISRPQRSTGHTPF